jgi:hypothetical protein
VSGNHEISVRYASEDARPLDLVLDGTKKGTIATSGTGGWHKWNTQTKVVSLNQGRNEIKLLAAESKGPNVNWLYVHPMLEIPLSRGSFSEAVVLDSGHQMSRNQFVFSPSRNYKVGLTNYGDLVLQDRNSRTIWTAGVSGGYRCYMQSDGNLIVKDNNKNVKWTSHTSLNPGARLAVDDGGRIAVISGTTALWLDGVPRGQYNGPSSNDLMFPVRGLFYYPWYPQTWTVNGKQAHFEPDLGFYSSGDSRVAEAHIDAFEYAHVDLSIASWWGPESNSDRARLTLLMDETIALNSQVKWTVYHEKEKGADPSPAEIREDLDYLKKWFAWHPAWAHKEGRPVIFVYNEGGCEVANRWMAAANGEWYVVLKLFPGYRDCPIQPDSWHQYAVENVGIQYRDYSYTIAPGFWRADRDTPRMPRLSESAWCQNVKGMVDSGEPWQLVVSFNEAGEGTMIEASSAWSSNTQYGMYLDCLHKFQ